MEVETQNIPLCVDLDYTLISTDILIEMVVTFIKKNPLNIFLLLFWYIKGKKYLKRRLLENVNISVEELPFRTEILSFLKTEKQKGKKLILVTASLNEIAKNVNNYLNFFDEVFGSNNQSNLKGKTKAKFLISHFGMKGFDYLGDSIFDFPIWRISNKSYCYSNSRIVSNNIKRLPNFAQNFAEKPTSVKDFFKLIRIHQWIKNFLVFVPLLLAHQFNFELGWTNSILAFFSISFLASSLYIFNDILDIQTDRKHPVKAKRPIASGKISAYTGGAIAFLLLVVSVFISIIIDLNFALVLALYAFINVTYSLFFKQIPLLDIFILSSLYVIRLYAGSIASQIPISNWLLAFSMFFFLSLAALKRFTELLLVPTNELQNINRPYNSDSSSLIQILGISSSFASVIIFILYINSEKVFQLYKTPELLWFLAFLLLIWNLNLWHLANKRKADFDPIWTSLKNPLSLILAILSIFVWFLAFQL